MNSKVLAGAVAVAVWYIIWDLFLFGPIFGSFLAGVEGAVSEPSLLWVIVGDLAAGLVLAWFYGKVGSAFGSGVKGGRRMISPPRSQQPPVEAPGVLGGLCTDLGGVHLRRRSVGEDRLTVDHDVDRADPRGEGDVPGIHRLV